MVALQQPYARAREGVTRNQHRRLDMAARSEMLQADQVYATLSARQLLDGFEDQWIDAVLQAREGVTPSGHVGFAPSRARA